MASHICLLWERVTYTPSTYGEGMACWCWSSGADLQTPTSSSAKRGCRLSKRRRHDARSGYAMIWLSPTARQSVLLGVLPPNPAIDRSAEQRRCLVPVALRTTAGGGGSRCAPLAPSRAAASVQTGGELAI